MQWHDSQSCIFTANEIFFLPKEFFPIFDQLILFQLDCKIMTFRKLVSQSHSEAVSLIIEWSQRGKRKRQLIPINEHKDPIRTTSTGRSLYLSLFPLYTQRHTQTHSLSLPIYLSLSLFLFLFFPRYPHTQSHTFTHSLSLNLSPPPRTET